MLLPGLSLPEDFPAEHIWSCYCSPEPASGVPQHFYDQVQHHYLLSSQTYIKHLQSPKCCSRFRHHGKQSKNRFLLERAASFVKMKTDFRLFGEHHDNDLVEICYANAVVWTFFRLSHSVGKQHQTDNH